MDGRRGALVPLAAGFRLSATQARCRSMSWGGRCQCQQKNSGGASPREEVASLACPMTNLQPETRSQGACQILHHILWQHLPCDPAAHSQECEAIGEETCHLLVADFSMHSCYTKRCWTQSGPHIRTPVPMPENSRAAMRTGSSRAASGTICLKKPLRPLPKLSSMSTVSRRRYNVL
jgi:hypothetical protein